MIWIYLAHAFGGMVAINTLPHLLAGLQGRPFPTPFAKPPGRGLSSPLVNVLWAAINAVIAWALLVLPAPLNLTQGPDALAFGLGALLGALGIAWHFGQVMAGER
ncbi:hypothetical protein ACXN5S_05290 [Pseudoroseicyclus sp. H15]